MTTRDRIDELRIKYDKYMIEWRRNAYKVIKQPFIVRNKETKQVIETFRTIDEMEEWLKEQ